jgi:hypothetical protein
MQFIDKVFDSRKRVKDVKLCISVENFQRLGVT